jgi:arylsulfatase A-like enzyme
MKFFARWQLAPLLFLFCLPSTLLAIPGDTDNDGLRDEVETGTGTYVSASNAGTNPNLSDTDGDSVPDGMEINQGTNPTNANSKTTRPNIILINCDDLGYGDIGCFWQNQKAGTQKFSTPGLDAMAAEGVMMTHHYVGAPICASSRASLLQGRHQGHADVRDKDFDKALPNNHSIASVLKSGGYKTVHIGKAGLAGPGEVNLPAHPLLRGFDRFFGYYSHYTSQEHYPQNGTTSARASLFSDYQKITGANVDLYTTDAFTGFAKKTIIEETQNNPNRPFFIYLAHTTPHFPNAVPPTPGYPAGLGLNGGVQWTGPPSYVNTATNNPNKINNIANQHPSVNPAWPQYAREHVSMIRRIDDSVSDILQTLRDLNIDRNTLVVFTVDNGCDDFQIDPRFFQGFANFEGKKTDMWEGGIRIPTIAWWPGKINGTNNPANIARNTRPSGNWDWLATFADFAKIPAPSYTDGVSIAPSLSGSGTQRDKGYLYFEFNYLDLTRAWFPIHGNAPMGQMQNVRIGDFMGTRRAITGASDNFMIYNMATDDKQQFNIAATRPDLQARMKYLAISARRPGGGVTRPYDTANIPAVTPAPVTNGLSYQCYEGYWPWIPEFRDLTAVSSGLTSGVTPTVRSRSNDVGISYTGYISVPTAGAYTFATSSNAATSLWIHEGHVIDNDFNFTPNKSSDPVYLAEGLHPIRLYYRHQSGTPTLTLSYSGPGLPLQAVPASSLFTEGPAPVFALQPDSIIKNTSTATLIDVLANDSGNYSLSLSAVGNVDSGSASIIAGKIFYTPANGFLGTATFPYTVTGGAATASSTVTADVLFDNETWISMNESSGSAVRAVSPTTLSTGTLTGTTNPNASWIPGKSGTCLSFDGVDDQVTFPGLTLPAGSAPRTFACWVRTPATATGEDQTIFSHGGDSTSGQRFTIRLDNVPNTTTPQRLQLEVNGGFVVGTKPINDGLWHHLAVVLSDQNNNGTLNINETLLYVDGVLDPISSVTAQNISTTSGFAATLGGSGHDPNFNFKGDIDDIRIFPRALSSAEVGSLGPVAAILPPGDGDSDGDGASNLQEFIAGTDPEDIGSLFKIHTSTRTPSGTTLQWAGVAGRTYRVEESTNLSSWTLVPGVTPVVVTSPQPTASVTIPANSAPTRFLRLQVMLTP